MSVILENISRKYVFRKLEIRIESSCLNQHRTGSAPGPGFRECHADCPLLCPPNGTRVFGAKCMCHIDRMSSPSTMIGVLETQELPTTMTLCLFPGLWVQTPGCYGAYLGHLTVLQLQGQHHEPIGYLRLSTPTIMRDECWRPCGGSSVLMTR